MKKYLHLLLTYMIFGIPLPKAVAFANFLLRHKLATTQYVRYIAGLQLQTPEQLLKETIAEDFTAEGEPHAL